MEDDTQEKINQKRDIYKKGHIKVDTHGGDIHGGEHIWRRIYTKGNTYRGRYTGEENYTELSTKSKDYLEWSILIKYIE